MDLSWMSPELRDVWDHMIWPLLLVVASILIVVVPLIIAMAYLTYAERKVIAAMQLRKGPNVVGPFGLLQPFADGVKLMFKETIIPTKANKVMFLMAPMLTFALAMLGWAVIPLNDTFVIADINVGILYLFAISSLGVYGIIISGWASNSQYAFLGAIRSSAQMVSYEVSIGLVIVTVLLCAGSLNMGDIVRSQAGGITHWYAFSGLLPMFVIFFISALAETNRLPFDLPEAEGELVAGYNVEYSAMSFALFFLGEYMNMILMGAMTAILFLGGWYAPVDVAWLNWIPGVFWLMFKIALVLFVFLWVRATFPRYRYDQLMRLGWKIFLPTSLLWVVLTSAYVVYVKDDGRIAKGQVVQAVVEKKTIGSATMDEAGVITLQLRAEGPEGTIGDTTLTYAPGDEKYASIKHHLGNINPGESVLVAPFPETEKD